ncbi:MAG: methyltransferase domain-containing protein [Flavobacteriales bacterium]
MTDAEYWKTRWRDAETGWDVGQVSRPIQRFIDQLTQKDLVILVPGAGSGWEVEYVWRSGFHQVHALDIVPQARDVFAQRVPDFPMEQWHTVDFFSFDMRVDLVLEQTFFCAINPELRQRYAEHMRTLCLPKGRLCGLFFQFPLTDQGPPFGGDDEEYRTLFTPYFRVDRMELCTDSIAPRMGRELWVEMSVS